MVKEFVKQIGLRLKSNNSKKKKSKTNQTNKVLMKFWTCAIASVFYLNGREMYWHVYFWNHQCIGMLILLLLSGTNIGNNTMDLKLYSFHASI